MLAFLLFVLPWVFLVLFLGAFFFFIQALFFWESGARVYGRVVENKEDFEGFTPIIAFEAKGAEYRFPVAIHRGSEPWKIGSERLVRYDERDPAQASLDDSLHRWRPVALLALPASTLLLVWIVLSLLSSLGR